MKHFEKLKIFKDAAVSAYKKLNADRDTAELLLENAVLIQDRYKLLAKLCKTVAEGLWTVRDEFSGADEASGSCLSRTLTNTITVLDDYVTVKPVECDGGRKLVSYLFCYDTGQGSAYEGICEIFDRVENFLDVNITLMKEKIEKRNFCGAIRQYIVLRDMVKSRCEENGIKIPQFSEINLDKYKIQENDN